MLETLVRALYRPDVIGLPLVHLVGRQYPDLCELMDLADTAVRSGVSELHLLAWEHPPEVRTYFPAEGGQAPLPVRLVQIPREVLGPPSKRPPVFREVGALTARRVSHAKGVVDVELLRFLPPMPISPKRAPETLIQRAAAAGRDFIDYWSIDFDYHSTGPFHHRWRSGRVPQERRIAVRSEAMWPARECGQIAVKVADVFGYDTLTLLVND